MIALSQGAFLGFTDVTSAAGLTHRHFFPGSENEVASITGGAVAEDFDGDGWIDLYVLQGAAATNLMYMNRCDGTFEEEAASRGASLSGDFVGACAADYDNDGDVDLCLTRLQANPLLLINQGAGYFLVDSNAIPHPVGRVMSPSWGDIDNDGLLDLVIGQWERNQQSLFVFRNAGTKFNELEFRQQPFEDRYVFSPVFADVNNDRWVDLLVVADFSNSQLYLNSGEGFFYRSTKQSNIGSDENGMGTAVGDFDNDGDLDWFVSSIFDVDGVPEATWGITGNRMYENVGDGSFVDATERVGVRDGNWGWGSAFGDLDNDGDLDLFHVNGWAEVRLRAAVEQWVDQPARLFENGGLGLFLDVASPAGVADRGQGRGTLLFDYDNDGDLDIFIVNNQELASDGVEYLRTPGRPVLLRNDGTSLHWLKVELRGAPPRHRHGIGSRVYAKIGSQQQMRELNASTGFLAHGPNRIAHFGLGETTTLDELRAEWNDGTAVILSQVPADQSLILHAPSVDIGPRDILAGETVRASAAGSEPIGTPRHWLVNGQAYPDPLSIRFSDPGEVEIELQLMRAEGDELIRRELYRLNVHRFSINSVQMTASSDNLVLAWEGLRGRAYQAESCTNLLDASWNVTGPVVQRSFNGVRTTTLPLPKGQAFYRLRLLEAQD